jgi:hypothetical protein
MPRSSVFSDDGRTVSWELVDPFIGNYRPPEDFRAEAGETWHFEINLPDGTNIIYDPETIPPPVPLNGNVRNANPEGLQALGYLGGLP